MALENSIVLEKIIIISVPTVVLFLNVLFMLSIYRLLKLIKMHQPTFHLSLLIPTIFPFIIYFILMLFTVFSFKINYYLLIGAMIFSLISYFFMWFIFPFALPRVLKKHIDPQIQSYGSWLTKLGFLLVLLPLGFNIQSVDVLFFIAVLIVWVSYWVIILKAKKIIRLKWKNY